MDTHASTGQAEPNARPPFFVQEPAAEPDSFDEDLLWITDKLVSRTGGAFGLIVRCSATAAGAEVLANAQTPPGVAATIAKDIVDDLTWRPASASQPDSAGVHQASLPIDVDGSRTLRSLALRFRPTERVTILAVVCRPDGDRPFTAVEEHIASLLYPVLARYIRLWWLHRTERHLVHALSSALDLTDNGLILLSRSGEMLLANYKATTLLDGKDGLHRCDGSISAWRSQDGLRLHAAVRHAVHCNANGYAGDGESPHAAIVALDRRVGHRKLLVAVVAVRHPAIDSYDPAVIVYILDPQPDVGGLLSPVCTVYGLSASETRLVHQLARGLSLSEAAIEMRVQPHTARTYLKQVFAKTNTHRQSDLMRVVFLSLLRTSSSKDLAFLSSAQPSNGGLHHA